MTGIRLVHELTVLRSAKMNIYSIHIQVQQHLDCDIRLLERRAHDFGLFYEVFFARTLDLPYRKTTCNARLTPSQCSMTKLGRYLAYSHPLTSSLRPSSIAAESTNVALAISVHEVDQTTHGRSINSNPSRSETMNDAGIQHLHRHDHNSSPTLV